jgi:hypothetical protein
MCNSGQIPVGQFHKNVMETVQETTNKVNRQYFSSTYAATVRVCQYGCGTWSLTLTEERRLIVFENRVLRRIFGPKRDEVTGEWKKLHNE